MCTFMLMCCKGRLVSPEAICNSPVAFPVAPLKALCECFSSVHVYCKLNLLF